MSKTSRQQQQRHSRSVRGISRVLSHRSMNYDYVPKKTNKKTLYFTSSTSTTMPLTDGSIVAYTGLYKCILNEKHKEYDSIDGDYQQQCQDTQKVANGFNRDGKRHTSLPLHNLQFHNGDNETKKIHKNDGITSKQSATSRASYLYANTYIDNKRENPDVRVGSWEILRAKLPGNNEETVGYEFRFETVFRTLEVFDWNECGFKCCPYNPNTDDDPFNYSKDEENNYYSHTHAYVRTIPRSFAVDETTGEIFISWEGFYQSCDPASLVGEKKLQWTIGVSRLRTEDPYCVTDQANVMENNFPRCTEPVSIVYQSSRGRDVVLPHGGFTVIASGDGGHRRSFLLTALKSHWKDRGKLESHVWSVPEGGNRDQEHLSLNGDGTSIDDIFMDKGVWDGGTLRLHYNPHIGRPDHLCRSIFNKGIGCMPISVNVTGENQDLVNILPQGEEDIVLTEEQVDSFCRPQDVDPTDQLDRGRKTPFVTGLEIDWNEDEENGTGSPKRVIFGCFTGEGNNKKFGIIDVHRGEGAMTPPVQVMKGAYPGAMLFLPHELEKALTSPMDFSTGSNLSAPSSVVQKYKISFTPSFSTMIVFLLLCILYSLFHSKTRSSRIYRLMVTKSPHIAEEKGSLEPFLTNATYVELPTLDYSLKTIDG